MYLFPVSTVVFRHPNGMYLIGIDWEVAVLRGQAL